MHIFCKLHQDKNDNPGCINICPEWESNPQPHFKSELTSSARYEAPRS